MTLKGEWCYLVLSRYQHGHGGLEASLGVSAFYGRAASLVTSAEFFRVGGQPVLEDDRIDDNTELTVLEVSACVIVLQVFMHLLI